MAKFNVTDHDMVPEHVLLDEDEVQEVLERYGIRKADLPKIGRLDPAVKQTDAEPGDVLKIVRQSRTAGEAVVYRLVIDE